jgi:hypothetical protein
MGSNVRLFSFNSFFTLKGTDKMGYLDMAKSTIKNNPSWEKRPLEAKTQKGTCPSRPHFPNVGNEITEKDEKNNVTTKPSQTDLRSYQTLFEQAVTEVSTLYLPGTLEMVREDFSDLACKTQTAEDLVNELWMKAKEGAGDFSAFCDAVERWKNFHLMGIKIFRFLERNN